MRANCEIKFNAEYPNSVRPEHRSSECVNTRIENTSRDCIRVRWLGVKKIFEFCRKLLTLRRVLGSHCVLARTVLRANGRKGKSHYSFSASHAKSGYIIPLTLMLISMAVALVTVMYQRGSVFVPLMSTMVRREQAKMVARSGIEIAMAQLTQQAKASETNEPNKQPAPLERELLSTILPLINRWQEFQLKQNRDGIEGTIKISLSCETGKIDINKIYDFQRRAFIGQGKPKGDWRVIMESLLGRIQKMTPGTNNLFAAFEKALQQRTSLFNDASELITLEAFVPFANTLFYEPPSRTPSHKSPRPLYLLDIFTVFGERNIQPWLFSDSLLGILGAPRARAGDGKQRQASVAEWISKWSLVTQWQTQWNSVLKPVYGLELQSLPNGLDSVLQERFDPTFFSVVSYGIVGDVTQRAYAIIERKKVTAQGKERYECKIVKFYWM